jgi:hypothetical protein
MTRAQPDWEATRAIAETTMVETLRDFVAESPGERSIKLASDGHALVHHGGGSWRWWVDPEPGASVMAIVDSPSYVPWQVEIWVRDESPHPPGLGERLRNAISPHSHATGTIRAGDDPAATALAIVRRELQRQTAR